MLAVFYIIGAAIMGCQWQTWTTLWRVEVYPTPILSPSITVASIVTWSRYLESLLVVLCSVAFISPQFCLYCYM